MNDRTLVAAAACLLAIIPSVSPLARADAAGDGAIPEVLKPPVGQVLALSAQGDGVQIYECLAPKEEPARYSWTFKAPEAVLRGDAGKALGEHYAGPTWEAPDGSKVVGEVVTKLDAPDAASIPWLLLRAKSSTGPGIFSAIAYVQRLHTKGGKSPATGCDQSQAGKEIRVPYSAIYRFYKSGP